MEKMLGKIDEVSFGLGGYQEAMIGISFTLKSGARCVNDFWGFWANKSEHTKWSEEDQQKEYGKLVLKIRDLLAKAKVMYVADLKNKPVEIIYDGILLKEWRILEEVL